MRYFLLDKVTELVPGERARGVKCVALSEQVLHDHFPEHPLLPGALIVEACAQLAGLLIEASQEPPAAGAEPRRALLVEIARAKFHDAAGPGDRLELRATLAAPPTSGARARFEAEVDGRRLASGELTFVLREVPSPRLHEQRRALYRLLLRDLDPPHEVR